MIMIAIRTGNLTNGHGAAGTAFGLVISGYVY
jgi:hypothetical protein